MGELAIPVIEVIGGVVAAGITAFKTGNVHALGKLLSGLLTPKVLPEQKALQAAQAISNTAEGTSRASGVSSTTPATKWFKRVSSILAGTAAATEHFAVQSVAASERIVEHIIPHAIGAAVAPINRDLQRLSHIGVGNVDRLAQDIKSLQAKVDALSRSVTSLGSNQVPSTIVGQVNTLSADLSTLSTYAHAQIGTLGGREANDVTAINSAIAALGVSLSALAARVATLEGEVTAGGTSVIPAPVAADVQAAKDWIAAHGADAVAAAAFVTAFAYTDAATMAKCLENWCSNSSALLGLLGDAAALTLLDALMAKAGVTPGQAASDLGDVVGDVLKFVGL